MAIDATRVRGVIAANRTSTPQGRLHATEVVNAHRAKFIGDAMQPGGLAGFSVTDLDAAGFMTPALRNGINRQTEDVGLVAHSYLDGRTRDAEDIQFGRDATTTPPASGPRYVIVADDNVGTIVGAAGEYFNAALEESSTVERRGLLRQKTRVLNPGITVEGLEQAAMARATDDFFRQTDLRDVRREVTLTGYAMQRAVEHYGGANPQVAALDASSIAELFGTALPATLRTTLVLSKRYKGDATHDNAVNMVGNVGLVRRNSEVYGIGWDDRNIGPMTSFLEAYTVQSVAASDAGINGKYGLDAMESAFGGDFGKWMPEKRHAQAYAKHKINPLVGWAVHNMVERGEI